MERLSSCEEQVMSVVWKCSESPDLRKVMDEVNCKFDHDWRPQTVSTFLLRLRKKGFLSSERRGRYTYYTPIKKMEDYKNVILQELDKMF